MVDFSRFRKRPGSPLQIWFERGEDESGVWLTLHPGPSLADIGSRISSIPRDFLDDRVSITAIAGDLWGDTASVEVAAVLGAAAAQDATRRGAAIALWLWASEELVSPFEPMLETAWTARALAALAFRLAPVIDPAEWLSNIERREEAARLFLTWSGALPEGEDAATARSLWERHDSLRRDAAMQAMLADHQHRVDVTRRLREKAAMEAAARYTHE